jgi:hypothetical protein
MATIALAALVIFAGHSDQVSSWALPRYQTDE